MLKKYTVIQSYNFYLKIGLLFFLLSYTLTILFLLNRSLWLDEFATVFAVKEGFFDSIKFKWMGLYPSPLFYGLTWLSIKSFGLSEFSLRAVSFITNLFNLTLLYHLTLRIADKKIAIYSLLIYLLLPTIFSQAINSRPYTLGVFFVLLSIFVITQFKSILISSLIYLMAFSSHYSFAYAFPFYFYFLFVEIRKRPLINSLSLLAPFILIGSYLLLPAQSFQSKFDSIALAYDSPPLIQVFLEWFGFKVFNYSHAFLVLMFLSYPLIISRKVIIKNNFIFCCIVYISLITSLLIVLNFIFKNNFTLSRYCTPLQPFLAICFGYLVSNITSPLLKKIWVAGLLVIFISNLNYRINNQENWRDAITAINSSTTDNNDLILAEVKYLESTNPSIYEDKNLAPFLLSPFSFYSTNLRLMFIPSFNVKNESDSIIKYLEKIHLDTPFKAKNVFYLANNSNVKKEVIDFFTYNNYYQVPESNNQKLKNVNFLRFVLK